MRTKAVRAAVAVIVLLGASAPVAARAARVAHAGRVACAERVVHAGRVVHAVRAAGARATPSTAPAPVAVVGDFNGDGRSDVLRYASGKRLDRLSYGTTSGFTAGPAIDVNGEYAPSVGDFNGDGKSDILWFALTGGQTTVWYGSSGPSPFRVGPALPAPSSVSPAGDAYTPLVADFNGDGKSDIAWADNGTGGPDANEFTFVWLGAANGFNYRGGIGSPMCSDPLGQGEVIAVCTARAADFNGDGRSDLFFYRSGRGSDALYYSTGPAFSAGPAIAVTQVYDPLVGDFNGDGKSDVYWYAPGVAHDYLWYGKASGFRASLDIDVNGAYDPLVGDFNGDGDSDVLWYAAGSGPDSLWYGKAGGFRNGPRINVAGNYAPRIADFNGDGKADVLWFSPIGRPSHVWYGKTSGFAVGNPVTL